MFKPYIDLSLSGLVLIAFLLHFHAWANSNTAETTVDLRARLPTANFRVITLLLSVVFICWITNIPVWLVFAILLVFGFGIALLLGNDHDGSGILLFFVAFAIREWVFGFPQLILHPPPDTSIDQNDVIKDLIGVYGTVVSPLRPCGDAELNGLVISVVSESGHLIDVGTAIVVSGTQNGRVCVRSIDGGP